MKKHFVLKLALVLAAAGAAAGAPAAPRARLGDTGFTLAPPPGWRIDTNIAGDLVFRAFAPGQQGFLEAYTGRAKMSLAAMAQGYEQRMQMAAKGWRRAREQQVRVAGAPAMYRSYSGAEAGTPIHVQAVFYYADGRSFLLHAVTSQAMQAQLFEPAQRALLSLRAPAARPGAAEEKTPAAGPAVLGQLGLALTPPPGWKRVPSAEPGLVARFAPADKMAALDAYDFGRAPAGMSADALLAQIGRSFESAMQMNPKTWKRTELFKVGDARVKGQFRCYLNNHPQAPTDVQVLVLAANGRMGVIYAITAQALRAKYFAPARAAVLSVVQKQSAGRRVGAGRSLFTTVKLDDVDFHMPIAEKSYLNELDDAQKQVIRSTYGGKK